MIVFLRLGEVRIVNAQLCLSISNTILREKWKGEKVNIASYFSIFHLWSCFKSGAAAMIDVSL